MKKITVNTTQNVPLIFELADISKRLVAFTIDNILKVAYCYFILYSVFKSITKESFGDNWSVTAILILLFLPVTFYSLISETVLNGQTLGKKLMRIRVINLEGFKPSKIDYIIRWFLRIIDFNFWSLLLVYFYSFGLHENKTPWIICIFILGKLIGFIAILKTNKSQRIGDMIANTVVISLKDDASFSKTILENIADTYKPSYPNVILLSDNDLRIIKDNYIKAKKSRDYKTLIKIREKIIEITNEEMKHKSDIEFIEIILKDYNYYTQDM